MSYPRGTLVRNTTATRVNHWFTAGSFVLLTLSGLSMFHPVLFWLSELFGGGQWTRAIHPWIGVTLVVSYSGLIVRFWRDNLPSWDDWAWIKAIKHVLANEDEHVPEVARFNPGQKLVFWAMTLLIPVLFVTGLVIWDVYFSPYTSIELQRIAVLIHGAVALTAIIIWIVHVYAALWVKGSIRAMTQGFVTPGWAWRHPPQMAAAPGGNPVPRADAAPMRPSTAAAMARAPVDGAAIRPGPTAQP